MMLLESLQRRGARQNLWLGGTTAMVAGLVNVCAVIAFFAFASNVTGYWAILAEETVKGYWHQVSVVLTWLLLFIFGAFVSNMLITSLRAHKPHLGQALPCALEISVLAFVGYYGHHHYMETLWETEILVGALLFAMGVQNGMVSGVSNNVVKTTHLTGLSTDLGMELALAAQPRYRRDAGLWFKLKLRFIILGGYVVGGLSGGVAYLRLGFQAFYLGIAILVFILVHDLVLLWQARRSGEAAHPTQHTPPRQRPEPHPASPAAHDGWKPGAPTIRTTNGSNGEPTRPPQEDGPGPDDRERDKPSVGLTSG
jgi:uncharacterized membrane protein YoaK (UPF0700 family)